MSKKFNQYLGKAGHLSAMAEFLILGWNVAIPEVDIGDDIFVVEDNTGTLKRVQVKTSFASKRTNGFKGQFSISFENLKNIKNILVHYVFLVRVSEGWTKPVIIRQDNLLDLIENKGVGSKVGSNVMLYFIYEKETVKCSKQNLTNYIQDFSDFPLLAH